jgi:hypothetical protein
MQTWTTPKPLATPIAFDTVSRIDLEFVDVHRDAGSFTALVFLNAGKVPPGAGRDHDRFAGWFTLFTRTECWGDEGHCDWRRDPVSPFDRRPQHHLTPINVSMDVTETIRRLGNPNRLEVTVHATRAGDPGATKGVFRFERLSVMSYA